MNLNFFIYRPVLAWVMSIMITVAGIVCYFQIGVREYPKISYPVITVEVRCPGFSSDVMEMQVTKVLEDRFASIESLKSIDSRSENDRTLVKLKFREDANINTAYVDVLSSMQQLNEVLPKNFVQKVTKADVDSSPVMYLVLYGDAFDRSSLYDYSVRNLESLLASLPGVASAITYGGSQPEMRILLNSIKLNHYGISSNDVVKAVYDININRLNIGRFENKDSEMSVVLVNDLKTEEEYGDIPIMTNDGSIIKFRDVGKVSLSAEKEKSRAYFNGNRAIFIHIISHTNPVDVSKEVMKILPSLRDRLPGGMKLDVAYDASDSVKDSIFEVYKSIIEAVILVVITILLFLRSFRGSIVPVITIPICLISTFMIIKFFGFSINVITLLALVLSVGLLVDDAILVLENIYRYVEQGYAPFEAAKKGFGEISSAVIAMTFTLSAVYLPILLYGGTTAKFFREFAVTLAGCVLISGFVAITLSPMMCARLLSSSSSSRVLEGCFGWFSSFDERLRRLYENYLNFVMNFKHYVLIGLVFLSVFATISFVSLPSEFSKPDDIGQIYISGLTHFGTPLDKSEPYVRNVEKLARSFPEVKDIISAVQLSDENYLVLTLKKGRKRSSFELAKIMNEEFKKMSNVVQFYAYAPSSLLSSSSSKQYDFTFLLQSNGNYDDLISNAGVVLSQLRMNPNVHYAQWDLSERISEIELTIDLDMLTSLGVTNLRDVADQMSAIWHGKHVTTFSTDGYARYRVLIVADKEFRETEKDIFTFMYPVKKGSVSLNDVFKMRQVSKFPEVKHSGALRTIGFGVKVREGCSNLDVYKSIKNDVSAFLPDGVFLSPGQDLVRVIEESNTTLIMFLLAIVFVFLIMAAQFESFVSPLIVMFTVPLALSGALFTLRLIPDGSLNIFSNIGFITLVGLITKHGILIVDFADKMVRDGYSIQSAIINACLLRWRAILMTTFAMVLGSLPLALATGTGSAVRRQLGWVIVGGMSTGTLFILLVFPVVYSYIKPFAKKKVILE
ncbi:efflux RND transporter permease subunit [Candidatus Gromoviella agglomerans]|uniref:efflux RND transporter permease subunit n=1 Tax=Candidatus Gromoviella agglomerans TaxID=2806609 RepID=UPI001E4BC143|nr:efflux RND transporter permease subunit [Candidatus Gromoviella agglomerans]UFX98303.1 Acr transporter superfamily protein [Candidatus Gromoviella agglomerans]